MKRFTFTAPLTQKAGHTDDLHYNNCQQNGQYLYKMGHTMLKISIDCSQITKIPKFEI